MCGIIGYIGPRNAYEVVIKGLKRLEYRGYDSAGLAIVNNSGEITIEKCKGKVIDLEKKTKNLNLSGNIGIGHTRWATHGEPNDINAHPHVSMNKKFILIHNGIIENYHKLKKKLEDRGYVFVSQTDTEVIANLIEYIYIKGQVLPEIAIRLALTKLEGAFGLVVISAEEKNTIYAARRSSPIVIGVGDNEYFIASDATPIVEYTNRVIFLKDEELAIIKENGFTLKTFSNVPLIPEIQKLDLDVTHIEKNGYEHFMLKEIFEQPQTILDTFRGRLSVKEERIVLGGLFNVMDKLINAKRIIIVGCGTSWHAGLVGKYLLEDKAKIPTIVEYASEFRYRNPVIYDDDIVIAISQSGETADTLAAIRLVKQRKATVLGICNVVGSSIARETDAGVFTHAGPEIGVASTKAFTAQLTVLTLLAVLLGYKRGFIDNSNYKSYINEIYLIPEKVHEILKKTEKIKEIANSIYKYNNALFLGRGYLYPIALEGALKLKEISYIHAEGYPAAEMKHGPIALIDENMPVIIVASSNDITYEKIISNIQEVKSRKGKIISVINYKDKKIRELSDYIIEIPDTYDFLTPLLSVVPLQLLAYYTALYRNCSVDQPRNLAKSVTVE